jgi:UDP-galactopyranose mutase
MAINNTTSSLTQQGMITGKEDLICLSHLRWNFVYQRPQHLMRRCAQERRVFFVEEPLTDQQKPYLEIRPTVTQDHNAQIWVVVPHIPAGLSYEQRVDALHILIDELLVDYEIGDYILWYYTPEALSFTRHLGPQAIIYDCMDELSLFKGANPHLCALETELFSRADLVFTGGWSLYAAKSSQHNNVHCFPSSIDMHHFEQARTALPEPDDQKQIPHPRLGFFGVLDERLDLDLLAGVATARPDWQLILVGPIVKISSDDLPKNKNIHYLGMKDYQSLPAYLAGWDVALLPFALNESTRYISPTKTPEYLAGGKPVVSTPITDVVNVYGEKQLVRIARNADEFVQAIEQILSEEVSKDKLLERDAFLAEMSWDKTWKDMSMLIDAVNPVVKSGA